MNVRQRFFYFQTLLIFKCIHGLAPQYLTNNIVLDIEIKEKRTRQHDMKMFFYKGAKT